MGGGWRSAENRTDVATVMTSSGERVGGAGPALAAIVIGQVLGTSVWFVGTAAAEHYRQLWDLSSGGRGLLQACVQAGFVAGTLTLALTGCADRFAASRLFAVGALLAALANLGFALASTWLPGMALRFATGVALAAVYPLGMKLVVSRAPQRKGEALGWLVGALTLGSALPFALRGMGVSNAGSGLVAAVSLLPVLAAALVLGVGDGPNRTAPAPFDPTAIDEFRTNSELRRAALGYFGHMWELYAFWGMVPALAMAAGVGQLTATEGAETAGSILGIGRTEGFSFLVIAGGALGCVGGGRWSARIGGRTVASVALAVSGIACLLFPLAPAGWMAQTLLLVWGIAVVADSPQFSALSAAAVSGARVGSVLTLQNGIGFLITIIAIQVTAASQLGRWSPWLLAPGPLLGLWALHAGRPRGFGR
jgi:MFS family permease